MFQQLDIFDDSRDLMLRNDVLSALARRDANGARAACQTLRAEFADDRHLPALQVLIDTLQAAEPARFSTAAEALRAIDGLQRTAAPAARSVWAPAEADAWLRPAWSALARAAGALPFDPRQPQAHAAALWLRAGNAAAALAAVQTITSWRRVPQPLAWAVEATWRAEGLDAAWPLIAELAWLAPARLAEIIARLDDPLMNRLHRAFGQGFDGDEGPAALAWFPAWVLTEKPALARPLSAAEPGQQTMPEQGFRLLLSLLELERQGRHADLIERRKRLLALHGGLFGAYMHSR
jgi:hypothetical protein